MTPHLTIGEIAQRTGLATSTLRYYESIGLLPKAARQSGQRRFEESVIQAVGFIKLAQRAGFGIQEIGALLHGFPTDMPPSERWAALARSKLEQVKTQMQQLLEVKRLLEQGLSCGCTTIETCGPQCAPVQLELEPPCSDTKFNKQAGVHMNSRRNHVACSSERR